MKKTILRVLLITFMITLAACGNDPGALKGTWKVSGGFPPTVIFRSGETESLGIIEKVSYKAQGNDVLVTYKNGIAKGMTMRYTMVNQNTARSELGTLSRIRR